jgi:thymidylate synthase
MQNYLDLLKDVKANGVVKNNRTGIETVSVFGRQLRFDLTQGFPLVTTKKVHFKSVVYELLHFISGSSNIKLLRDNGITIWDPWVGEHGETGRIYGVQWNHWELYDGEINQLEETIKLLQEDPDSRRIIVSAWNVGELDEMVLPPCHLLFQFYTEPLSEQRRLVLFAKSIPQYKNYNAVSSRKLSCMVTMRSCDVAIGLPYNIASYALLTAMVAQIVNMVPHEVIFSLGDAHIYTNLNKAVTTQLERKPISLPKLKLNPNIKSLWDFTYEDIELLDYNPHSAIQMSVAV